MFVGEILWSVLVMAFGTEACSPAIQNESRVGGEEEIGHLHPPQQGKHLPLPTPPPLKGASSLATGGWEIV